MKLMSDGSASSLRSPSLDAVETTKDAAGWDASNGLDGLMLSVSNTNLSSLSGSKDNLASIAPSTSSDKLSSARTTTTPAVAAPETVFSAPVVEVQAPKPAPTPVVPAAAIGSLSVATADAAATATEASKSLIGSAIKKPSAGLKKGSIGARKLGDATALKMDSFDVVEKNVAKAKQEEEDYKLSLKLQTGGESTSTSGGSGSSRLAAVYQESESIYRATPVAAPAASIYSGRVASATSSGGTGGSSKTVTSAMGESFEARERFSKSKSISSDQFFGNEDEEAAAARARLQRYSGATAISSDMLKHDEPVDGRGGGGGSRGGGSASGSGGGNDGIGKLRESVRDFFDNVSTRFG